MKIDGTIAIVTGASSGIGAAVAEDLARRGATVVVTARREAELETTAKACRRYNTDSVAMPADLSDADECARVVTGTQERFGRVDILINNAGVSLHRHALTTTPAAIEDVLRINFLAAVHTTMAALPSMTEQHQGSIINITSVAGYIPNPNESAYGASKAALHLWTHGLAVDLHDTGIHIGVLSPGPIDTEIWDKDETPSNYQGRKYPAAIVADGVARMINKELVHLTVPRRYGAITTIYTMPLLGRAIRQGLIRFEQTGNRRAPNSKPH